MWSHRFIMKVLVLSAFFITVALAGPQQYPQQYPYPPPPQYPQQQYPQQQYPQQQYPQYPVQQAPNYSAPPQQGAIIATEGRSCTSNFECDGGNTVLTCDRTKCVCPARPLIQWTRGPHPLNTAWDATLRKCLSVKNSACDLHNPKTVFCGHGLVCRGAPKDGFGLCVNSVARIGMDFTVILLGTVASYWFWLGF